MSTKFVVIEGIDGSGKSTLTKIVGKKLAELKYQINVIDKTEQVYESTFANGQMQNIKKALWEYPKNSNILEMGDFHWLSLIASWYYAIDELAIIPAKTSNVASYVLIDSWFYKYAARYFLKENFDTDFVNIIFSKLTKPDIIVFLNVDPKVAAKRKNGSFKPTECGVIEQPKLANEENFIKYQSNVQKQLLATCGFNNIIEISIGEKDIDTLANEIVNIILVH